MGIDRVALVTAAWLGGVVGGLGCGDDSATGSVDASTDTNVPVDGQVAGCGYTEAEDTTNATVPTAEDSGLRLESAPIAICGKIDTGHYDAPNELVDADGIIFAVAADTDVIVHLTGITTGTTPKRAVIQILKQGVNQLFGFGVVEGDHGTLIYRLPAGRYVAAVYALNDAAITTAIDYKVTIAVDTARCPTKTGTADHAEGGDGGANDVIDFNFTANNQSSLSTSTTDAPETTSITLASGSSHLITGALANVDPADDYMDRDTYAFSTGTANQVSIRVNWPSTAADLDYRVYPVPSGTPASIVGGVDPSDSEDEFETFAVKPGTTYWLWVAAEDGATLPTNYSATICGETFTP